MKLEIPDDEIKALILEYKRGVASSLSAIQDLLSPLIYNYPRIVFYQDYDICGDFYEYILKRLSRIIKSYRESSAQFATWFTIVLRTRYLNFLRERKTKNTYGALYATVSMDLLNELGTDLHSIVADSKSYSSENQRKYAFLIDGIVRELTEKQRLFFHLYYIEAIRPEDVAYLALYLERPLREIFKGIDELRNSVVDRYKKKYLLLQRLNDYYKKIINAQKVGDKKLESQARKVRESVLEEYRKLSLAPPYALIARVCNLPSGTVSTGIARMKKKLKAVIKEKFHAFM